MPDSSPGGKKRKITIVACQKGVKIAEKALIGLGFDSKSNFAVAQLLARGVVTKFFTQQPIQLDSFKRICEALELNWKEIAELQVESKNFERTEERQVESILSISEGVEPVQTIIARRVVPIDEQGQEIKKIAAVILEGDINSVQTDILLWHEYFSKKYPGSTLKVTSIKPGSIKLIIEGTQKDLEMLLSDFESGNLTEIAGFRVEDVQLLSESAEDDESSKQKWRLVEEIVTNPIKRRDLSGADLSDADLRNTCLINANLSYADLSDSDLSDADLSRADLSDANLSRAYLSDANLSRADLSDANLSRTYLSDANLSRTYLSDANLIGADLIGANLIGANLNGAIIDDETKIDGKWRLVWKIVNQRAKGRNLRNANLSHANLSRAYLSRADLSRADLSRANLSDAYLSRANLSDANLSDANLSSANLSSANLSGANLSGANLSGADLSDADLIGADLNRAIIDDETKIDGKWRLVWKIVNQRANRNLSGANLSGANLSRANLSDANLSRANLSNASLSDASLIGANLSDASLSRANLSNANLTDANLSRANLSDANLSGAYLSRAYLIGVDLSGADLSGANLIGADLSGANLSRANLSRANLSRAVVKNARFGGSLGISESMKQDLIKRGAIFEDSPGDRSSIPVKH
ncbi:MAG TPA: hypothetical protein DCY88_08425 [Cyanobacteria bacterium UBA11372]|nr:hypothetical protein [Cyanobacteria bacterium UBA11372]